MIGSSSYLALAGKSPSPAPFPHKEGRGVNTALFLPSFWDWGRKADRRSEGWGEPKTDRHTEPHLAGPGLRGEVDPGDRSARQSSTPPRIIVLTGFMGTGKSTVGQIVAERLGWPFVDTDDGSSATPGSRSRRFSRSTAKLPSAGWSAMPAPAPRSWSDTSSRPAAARCSTRSARGVPGVRAGSLPARGPRHHIATSRIRRGSPAVRRRPGAIGDLLAARAPLYDSLPHQVETTGRSPEAVAEEIVRLWHTFTS